MDAAGVAKAVRAFWENDPYYPRPGAVGNEDEALWKVFEGEYLEQSVRSGGEYVRGLGLPRMFIEGAVQQAKKRGEGGDGPPSGPPSGPPRRTGAGAGEDAGAGAEAAGSMDGRRGRGARRRGGFQGVLERLNLDHLR